MDTRLKEKSRTILFVEDDDEVADPYENLLRRNEGFNVFRVRDYIHGVYRSESQIDVVILDLNLTELPDTRHDGPGLLRFLFGNVFGPPVILHSAYFTSGYSFGEITIDYVKEVFEVQRRLGRSIYACVPKGDDHQKLIDAVKDCISDKDLFMDQCSYRVSIENLDFLEDFCGEFGDGILVIEAAINDFREGKESGESFAARAFLALHTIKGNSGLIGLKALGRLSHSYEEVLDKLRAGSITPSEELFSVMENANDVMELLSKFSITNVDQQNKIPLKRKSRENDTDAEEVKIYFWELAHQAFNCYQNLKTFSYFHT